MIKIIKMAKEKGDDIIVICEDDHYFTENYSPKLLFKEVTEAYIQGAEVFPVVLEDLDKRSLQDIIVIKLTGFGAHSSLLFIIVFLIRCWIIRFRILTQPME